MSAVTTPQHKVYSRLSMNRAGLWLFFVSEIFMFSGMLVTRFVLLPGTRPELDQTLGLIVTGVLLASSYFMYQGEVAIRQGKQSLFTFSTLVTLLLGILFLVGVVGLEWGSSEFGPSDGAVGAVFFLMTGMHAFHVLTGVIFLMIVYVNGVRGKYSAGSHWAVESCALYWHFIDVVWVFFYAALYLVGDVA